MEGAPLEPTLIENFPFRESRTHWTRMEVAWDDSIRFTRVATLEGPVSDFGEEVISLAEYRPRGNQADGDNNAITTHTTTASLISDPYGNHVVHSGRFGKILPWKVYANEDEDCVWKLQFGTRPPFGHDTRTPCNEPSPLRVLNWVPPDFLRDQGELYDLDFDDSRARLVLYMSHGTVFVIDFI
jgi:hypothetical protein